MAYFDANEPYVICYAPPLRIRTPSMPAQQTHCIICKEEVPDGPSKVRCSFCRRVVHKKCVFNSETTFTNELRYVCNCTTSPMELAMPFYQEFHEFLNGGRETPRVFEKKLELPSSPANDTVQLLLRLQANPLELDDDHELPIHKAIRTNDLTVMNTFLAHNGGTRNTFVLNHRLYRDQTILHFAATYGSVEAVELLVDYGANINALNCIHQTPIFMAAARGNVEIMKYLALKGAQIGETMIGGRTLLHATTWHEQFDATKWLLEEGLKPTIVNKEMWSPLHNVAATGNVLIADLLIKHGAEIELKSVGGKSPLDVAKYYGHNEMVQYLQNAITEVNINESNTSSDTLVIPASR